MADKTKIPWASASWNVITGCTPASEGCAHCYAKSIATRFAGTKAYPNGFKVTFKEDKLDLPLKWKEPRRIFVNSMGDLFHDEVDFNWLVKVWEVMWRAPQHRYLILTKRPGRMLEFASKWYNSESKSSLRQLDFYPHVWMGVTAENQATADERIPLLLQVPAAVHFVSVEPMLGPVTLKDYFPYSDYCLAHDYGDPGFPPSECHECIHHAGLDLAICGAETGAGKRRMELDWARALRNECVAAGAPYFFKKDSQGNKILDGKEWRQFPDEV